MKHISAENGLIYKLPKETSKEKYKSTQWGQILAELIVTSCIDLKKCTHRRPEGEELIICLERQPSKWITITGDYYNKSVVQANIILFKAMKEALQAKDGDIVRVYQRYLSETVKIHHHSIDNSSKNQHQKYAPTEPSKQHALKSYKNIFLEKSREKPNEIINFSPLKSRPKSKNYSFQVKNKLENSLEIDEQVQTLKERINQVLISADKAISFINWTNFSDYEAYTRYLSDKQKLMSSLDSLLSNYGQQSEECFVVQNKHSNSEQCIASPKLNALELVKLKHLNLKLSNQNVQLKEHIKQFSNQFTKPLHLQSKSSKTSLDLKKQIASILQHQFQSTKIENQLAFYKNYCKIIQTEASQSHKKNKLLMNNRNVIFFEKAQVFLMEWKKIYGECTQKEENIFMKTYKNALEQLEMFEKKKENQKLMLEEVILNRDSQIRELMSLLDQNKVEKQFEELYHADLLRVRNINKKIKRQLQTKQKQLLTFERQRETQTKILTCMT